MLINMSEHRCVKCDMFSRAILGVGWKNSTEVMTSSYIPHFWITPHRRSTFPLRSLSIQQNRAKMDKERPPTNIWFSRQQIYNSRQAWPQTMKLWAKKISVTFGVACVCPSLSKELESVVQSFSFDWSHLRVIPWHLKYDLSVKGGSD